MGNYQLKIGESGLDIYASSEETRSRGLFIPTHVLETMLTEHFTDMVLGGLAPKTRSKVVKQKICNALGYPIPTSFKRSNPRFPSQDFDVYIQKKRNLQIWNEEISLNRRYVIFLVSSNDRIFGVKVLTGRELKELDRTGHLTQKYQASIPSVRENICSESDTSSLQRIISTQNDISLSACNPMDTPSSSHLLSINEIYRRLICIIGESFENVNATQDRNRGDKLHQLVCQRLGYSSFEDNGQYPDLLHQLLEIKLQTSPTIDLGLHSPHDTYPLDISGPIRICSQDIRYVIVTGENIENRIMLKNLYVVTGNDFTNHFRLFRGNQVNRKRQILLPLDFFILSQTSTEQAH